MRFLKQFLEKKKRKDLGKKKSSQINFTTLQLKKKRGFKALKKLCKLYFKENKSQKVVEKFKQLIEYGKTAVTNNIFEKGLNSIFDEVSAGTNVDLAEQLYNISIEWLAKNNERIWFRTSLKFGKWLYDRDEYSKLAKVNFFRKKQQQFLKEFSRF